MRVPGDTVDWRASCSFTWACCNQATTSRAFAGWGLSGASGSAASCLKDFSIEITDEQHARPLRNTLREALARAELGLEGLDGKGSGMHRPPPAPAPQA